MILSIPHLRRRDTIALLGGTDVLEINSIVFAIPASTRPKVVGAPSLGIYQTAPGQVSFLFYLCNNKLPQLSILILVGNVRCCHGGST